jgi:hypothetical protein
MNKLEAISYAQGDDAAGDEMLVTSSDDSDDDHKSPSKFSQKYQEYNENDDQSMYTA